MRLGTAIILAVVGCCLGCSSSTEGLPTQPPTPGGLAALLGPVTLEPEPQNAVLCIYARGPSGRFALVWPNGWYAQGSSPIGIFSRAGVKEVDVGQSVWLGGGEVPPPWPDLRGCRDEGHVWWVADVTHQKP